MASASVPPGEGAWEFRVWPDTSDPTVWTLAFHDPATFTQTGTFSIRFRDREHAYLWFKRRLGLTGPNFNINSFYATLEFEGNVDSSSAGQLAIDLHFASRTNLDADSPWFAGGLGVSGYDVVDADSLLPGLHPQFLAPGFACDAGQQLFVVRGDLRAIAGDAYLVPTDSRASINAAWGWLWGAPDVAPELDAESLAAFRSHGAVVLLSANAPVVVANTAFSGVEPLEGALAWLSKGLTAALTAFADGITAIPDLAGSHDYRPTLVMPVIGTKGGGLQRARGAVVATILDTLDQFRRTNAGATAFDVVLVCRSASDYSAVQAERRRRSTGAAAEGWLQPTIAAAQAGQLGVLFGAGASKPLGLPMWDELLQLLAHDFGLGPVADELRDVDPTDSAALLRDFAGSNIAFTIALAEHLQTSRASLMHVLLANLKPAVAITTNYDKGYEIAVSAMGDGDCAVLPWQQPETPEQPRLLKLHGDVVEGSVVLSRDDFVSMHAHRRPLGSMLQERMLVGHMLVVGSSMSDPTLVQAAEEVSSLVRSVNEGMEHGRSRRSGTVVLTLDDPVRRMLLERSFTVAVASDAGAPVLPAARKVLQMLDFIGMHADQGLGYLVDPAYDDLVMQPQLRDLVEQVRAVREAARHHERNEPDALVQFRAALLKAIDGI